MSGTVQERYATYPITANGTFIPGGTDLTGTGGFLCTTPGTLSVVSAPNVNFPTGRLLVPVLTCVAGVYYPLPFFYGFNWQLIVAGGLQGTLGLQ